MVTNAVIDSIEAAIHFIRGQKVMLDFDLAVLYGVSTKRLNEQFRRNRKRFPDDFAFQLTAEEASSLRSQLATASIESTGMWSQIAATSKTRRRKTHRPWAFTEHGRCKRQTSDITGSPSCLPCRSLTKAGHPPRSAPAEDRL